MTAFESDIPQALDIRSIVDGKHLPWYYAPVGPLAYVLCTVSVIVINFQLTSTSIIATTTRCQIVHTWHLYIFGLAERFSGYQKN